MYYPRQKYEISKLRERSLIFFYLAVNKLIIDKTENLFLKTYMQIGLQLTAVLTDLNK